VVTEYIGEEITLLVIVFTEGVNLEDHNECKTSEIFSKEKYGRECNFYRALRVRMVFYILCGYQQICAVTSPAQYSYACDICKVTDYCICLYIMLQNY